MALIQILLILTVRAVQVKALTTVVYGFHLIKKRKVSPSQRRRQRSTNARQPAGNGSSRVE